MMTSKTRKRACVPGEAMCARRAGTGRAAGVVRWAGVAVDEDLICVRCGRAVVSRRADYALFERMHWLCFHLEFEHEADPDEACGDPSCPWWHVEVFRRELERLGRSPDEVIARAIRERWNL